VPAGETPGDFRGDFRGSQWDAPAATHGDFTRKTWEKNRDFTTKNVDFTTTNRDFSTKIVPKLKIQI